MTPKSGIQIYVDAAHNFASVKHTDLVNMKSVMERTNMLLSDPDFHDGMNRLLDMRNCKLDIAASEVRVFSNHLKQNVVNDSGYRLAVVVNGDHAYAISRMFLSFYNQNNLQNKFFSNVDDALKWLNFPADYKLPFSD